MLIASKAETVLLQPFEPFHSTRKLSARSLFIELALTSFSYDTEKPSFADDSSTAFAVSVLLDVLNLFNVID